MREILFRGKLCGTGANFYKAENNDNEWVVGWYCPFPFGSWPLTPAIVQAENANRGSHTAWEVDPNTVGEYSQRKDKHGKMVFEGDILKIDTDDGTDDGERFQVELDCCEWIAESKSFCYSLGKIYSAHMEVVGNIYDNPELIGGEK